MEIAAEPAALLFARRTSRSRERCSARREAHGVGGDAGLRAMSSSSRRSAGANVSPGARGPTSSSPTVSPR